MGSNARERSRHQDLMVGTSNSTINASMRFRLSTCFAIADTSPDQSRDLPSKWRYTFEPHGIRQDPKNKGKGGTLTTYGTIDR